MHSRRDSGIRSRELESGLAHCAAFDGEEEVLSRPRRLLAQLQLSCLVRSKRSLALLSRRVEGIDFAM